MAIDRENYYVTLNDQAKPFRFYETTNAVFGIETDGSISMSNSSTGGIKLDLDTPNYGWRDMIGPIYVRSIGANSPNYVTYRGSINEFQFGVNDFVDHALHIPHDYAVGTDLYIHLHWSHNSASVTTGGITAQFEVTYAKGHDQAPFIAPITTSVTQTASTTQYQHMIAEVQLSATTPTANQLDSDDIEADGLLIVKTTLTGNTMSAATDPFFHFVDIHYQSTNLPTKNKAPNFHT